MNFYASLTTDYRQKTFLIRQVLFQLQLKLISIPTFPKSTWFRRILEECLLNLINNAFYAVQAPPPPGGGIKETQSEYKPLVIVKTSSYLPPTGGPRGASISVIDNGPGIPDSIKDKIFQPFFTTKPSGQGTGLGLSLAYDIVKAHGGELKVETKEGGGSEFIIQLPIIT
jgi:two-component system, NtrC family, sensor kinase